MFYSGLKVESLEALSFGAALVCTKVASTCLPLDKSYYQFEDEAACVEFLKELAGKKYESRYGRIMEMRAVSKKRYLMYKKKYPLKELVKALC